MTTTVNRPVLRYHGGKWQLGPWIISFFPKHQIYVEPFAGGASVLMQKKRSYTEVYNDLDKQITNIFEVLQERELFDELKHKLKFTPYSRDEFEKSHLPVEGDQVEQARRTIVRSWFGIGTGSFSNAKHTGFRAGVKKRGTQPHRDWEKWKDCLDSFNNRLLGVVIEKEPAEKVIRRNDSKNTLFYVDPPYLPETRGKNWKTSAYKYEMTKEDHVNLSKVLNSVKGMVVLSGYESDLYNQLYPGWERHSKSAIANGAIKGSKNRREMLWLNPACSHCRPQISMFNLI